MLKIQSCLLFNLNSYLILDEKIKKKNSRKLIFRRDIIEIKEDKFHYIPFKNDLKKCNIYIEGYWQSYKYSEDIQNELRKELKFRMPLSEVQLKLCEKIKKSKSVCVNFRRADFVSIPSAIETHGVPTLEYYYKAIKYLKQKVGDDIDLYVFSDDITWCQLHFKPEVNAHFVEHEIYKGDRFSSYLELMTNCDHFIIPNSTFGWWAAWLSEHSAKIVITPEKWFVDPILQSQTQDLRPPSWITIDV